MDVAMRWLALASISLCASSAAMADPLAGPRFVELGHSVDSFSSAATSRFAHADVDGDGIQDLVFTGYAQASVLFVAGKKADATLGFKQADVIAGGTSIARVLSWDSNGVPHILVVGASGTVWDYSGWPLKLQRQFPVVNGAVAATIGDIDADGNSELVVLTASALNSYSASDGQLRWTEPVQNKLDLVLAQLDADPALEIILAGGVPGIVLDGATRAIDWSYIDGFGAKVAVGRLASGGGFQWVGANQWQSYSVFRAAPWSPLWSGNTQQDIGAIATADIDNSGRDVILVGDGQWGSVHLIDSITRLERLNIPNQGWGINAVVATDLDGDGSRDIVFATAGNYPRDPLVTIASSTTGTVKWAYFPSVGPFIASGIADLDGDGRDEIVAASGAGYGNGSIAIMDARTGSVSWRAPENSGNANDPFYMTVRHIAFRDRTTGPGKDIILAGSSTYDGRILIVDGVTRQVRLQIGFYASGPLRSRNIKGLKLYDYNHDGVDDFILATDAQTTGSQGARLEVLSGVDGAPLWSSVSMGSGFSPINDVLLAEPPAGKSGKELVAVLPGSLRGYNSESGLLNWTLAVDNVGAVYIQDGVAGAEFAVFDETRVRFYDASSRALLREATLPSPLRALTVLNGNVRHLVASAANKLVLLDGVTGLVTAETPYLGPVPAVGGTISAMANGSSTATISLGTEAAFYRHRLELTDRILQNGFDSF